MIQLTQSLPEIAKFRSRPSLLIPISLGLVIIGFAIFVFSNLNKKYPDLTSASIFCFASGVFSYFLWYYVQKDCFDFYDTFLVSYKRYKSERIQVFYKDIVNYDIVINKGRNGKRYDLNFQTVDNQYFEMSTDNYLNEIEFRTITELITPHAQQDKDCTKTVSRKDYRHLGIGMISSSLLLLIFSFIINSDFKPEPRLNHESVEAIVGSVSKFQARSSKKTYWYDLSLAEYPDFNFNVNRVAYKVFSNKNLKNDPIALGDTLRLMITKRDYNYKIAQTITPTWKDFFDKYQHIEPCQIEKITTKTNYYSLEKYIQNGGQSYQANGFNLRILMFAVLFIGLLILAFNNRK